VTTPVDSVAASKIKALIGVWTFKFSVNATPREEVIAFLSVEENNDFLNGNGYVAKGMNLVYGYNNVVALYLSSSDEYLVLDQGEYDNSAYLFKSDGTTVLEGGCWDSSQHLYDDLDSIWYLYDCQALTGAKAALFQ